MSRLGIMFRAVAVALVLLAGGGPLCAQDHDEPLVPQWDGYAWDNSPGDGMGDAVFAGSKDNDIGGVGHLQAGEYDRIERGLLCFVLPQAARGVEVESAKLKIFFSAAPGDTSAAPPVVLYHNQPSTVTEGYQTYFENAQFEKTEIEATPPSGDWVELDVTQFVQADYDMDKKSPVSWFRLQLGDETRTGARYVFKLSKGEHSPTLAITFK